MVAVETFDDSFKISRDVPKSPILIILSFVMKIFDPLISL
jgi:hypothetical protein